METKTTTSAKTSKLAKETSKSSKTAKSTKAQSTTTPLLRKLNIWHDFTWPLKKQNIKKEF
jgi:hypothetical protein